MYLSNQLKAVNDQVTITAGLRYANMHYGLQDLSGVSNGDGSGSLTDIHSYDDHYLDPRLGLTYSPVRDLVFRSSYATESQFPDSRLPEVLFPENNGTPATATSPAAQLKYLQGRYAQSNHLRASHANNFDLGVEKGFSVKGLSAFDGAYNVTLTGFTRKQGDLIQYTRVGYGPSADGSTSLHGVSRLRQQRAWTRQRPGVQAGEKSERARSLRGQRLRDLYQPGRPGHEQRL